MLIDPTENLEAERRKQQEFFDLAERFRGATEPEDVKRLGDQLGRMVFGGLCCTLPSALRPTAVRAPA